MINQFRRLNPVNLIFLAAIALVLRIGILVNIPDTLDFELFEPYTELLINVPSDLFSPFSNIFYSVIIILIQALILNKVVNSYNLLGKPSFLPALMYVTASSLLVPFLVLSPALIANFLTIWMIEKFLSIYRRERAIAVMYDLGMIVAAGTLIYFPFISMLPLLGVSLLVFRPFNWREWTAGLLGFVTIGFFMVVLYYLNGNLHAFLDAAVPLLTSFRTGFPVNMYDYIVLIPVFLILVLSLFSLRQTFSRSNVHVRKSYNILLFLFLFAIVSVSLKPGFHVYHFLLAVPSISILMASYFTVATRRWFYESLYLLLVVFIIYFQFV